MNRMEKQAYLALAVLALAVFATIIHLYVNEHNIKRSEIRVPERPPSFEAVIEHKQTFFQALHRHWIEERLWSAGWWVLLVVTFLPWFVWWRFADKGLIRELLLYGMLVAVMATLVDAIAGNLFLWEHRTPLVSLISPEIYTYNYTTLPVLFMFLYQWTHQRPGRFIGMLLLTSVFAAFVMEPLLAWLNIHYFFQYQHAYNIPVYFLTGLFPRWLIGHFHDIGNPNG